MPAASRKTWSDCFSCKFTVMQQLCKHLAQSEIKVLGGSCPTGSVPMVHTGLYAAQIAWWLAFFPPERFLILTSSELRDPTSAVLVCTTTAIFLDFLDQQSIQFVIMQHFVHFVVGFYLRPITGWCGRSRQGQTATTVLPASHLFLNMDGQQLGMLQLLKS